MSILVVEKRTGIELSITEAFAETDAYIRAENSCDFRDIARQNRHKLGQLIEFLYHDGHLNDYQVGDLLDSEFLV